MIVLRKLAAVLMVLLLSASFSAPVAMAIPEPSVPSDAAPPPDPAPAPATEMQQRSPCNVPGVLPAPPVADPSANSLMLALDEAHKTATGEGEIVGIIDTGVTPNPRIQVEAGGDYVQGEGSAHGLFDCDAHGSLIAGIIGAAPSPGDPVVGVAPAVKMISSRQSSQHWSATKPNERFPNASNPSEAETAGRIDDIAAALVHLANMNARVINMSTIACVPAAHPVDQTKLAIAVWYAAKVKDVLLVAAAGNTGAAGGNNPDCQDNPGYDPLLPNDPRNWGHVVAVSTPSWFKDYVMSVGAVDRNGAPASFSMSGPWVDIAGPGQDIITIGPDGNPINALPGKDGLVPIEGTSFAAAYVSGVAALVRSAPEFKNYTAAQVRRRLTETAHPGPRGLDNKIGHGLVDPVAALTMKGLAPGPRDIAESNHKPLVIIPDPPKPSLWPQRLAWLTIAVVTVGALLGAALRKRFRKGTVNGRR